MITVIVVAALIYAVSPLFRNTEINEELPTSMTQEHLSDEEKRELEDAMEEANSEELPEAEEDMPGSLEVGESHEVVGTTGHPASGEVRIVSSDTSTYLRYENFSTINGPDLHIYLAKDLEATEFIDLGPIKANKGNINYEVPEGVDLREYKYVMHWCVPFRVLFNYAEIK